MNDASLHTVEYKGNILYLDGKKLKGVQEMKIESTVNGFTELSIKLVVDSKSLDATYHQMAEEISNHQKKAVQLHGR